MYAALLAGFVFLRLYAVSTTLYMAVAANVVIGLVSIALQRTWPATPVEPAPVPSPAGASRTRASLPATLVLWGIGLSGFCALGYEVLWTRVLTMAVGASVYGFTIILVAFLTGIALGSKAYGLLVKIPRMAPAGPGSLVAWFGATQVLIGITALVVTTYLRDIPAIAIRFETAILDSAMTSFGSRTACGMS